MSRCLSGFAVVLLITGSGKASAQFSFDSGSDGSDGELNPLENLVIDMTGRPDGIYEYSSVNIPAEVTVTFNPNAGNTPVTWLVQDTCIIDGTVSVNGLAASGTQGGAGGPGGFRGGNGSPPNLTEDPGPGFGPGGGKVTSGANLAGAGASYGGLGGSSGQAHPVGNTYGNSLLLPLIGGSGGGGSGRAQIDGGGGSGGGGGAILIAATNGITVTGAVNANGAQGVNIPVGTFDEGGSGSGGAIRLVGPILSISGSISAGGAPGISGAAQPGGLGRVRLEGDITGISGTVTGSQSTSAAPGILILPAGVLPALTISSVGGVAAPAAPTGDLGNPDIVFDVSATNPMDVVVDGQNLEPDTLVTVEARPENGPIVTATGNLAGTVDASSTTISMDLPAGAGVLFAHAVNEVIAKSQTARIAETGLAPNGEPFVRVEVESVLGGATRLAYVTGSGARFPWPPEARE